jgi:outer membrane protein, heavy metal efflux system
MYRSPAPCKEGPVKPVLLLFLLACAATGCASVSPKGSFEDVSALVAARGGAPIHWDQGTPADAQVKARVDGLLIGTLTAEGAVEVALLRNQGLVATYEELGIAQADLVQAGLLRNPSFGTRVRFPTSNAATDIEFSVAQDFLGLFTLPLRKRVAAAQLDATKARVGSAILMLTAQVRQAVVSLQASQATVEVRKLVLEAQSAAAELRSRQRAAGNIGDLDAIQQQAFFEQGELDLGRAEMQAVEQREQVNRLLGLWGQDSASWKVESRLPDVPEQDPSLDQVESLAIGRRLDLLAARADSRALEEAASLAGLTRFLPALQVGVSTERDAEGTRVTGPDLSIELPIFDQGQARAARTLAEVRQARARQADLAVNIRSEVRALRNRLVTTHRSAEQYRTVLLPLREKAVKESQLRYNAMLLGVFQLLQARREQIEAYRDYLDTVRDYWIARAELERATGGSLDAQPPKEKNL